MKHINENKKKKKGSHPSLSLSLSYTINPFHAIPTHKPPSKPSYSHHTIQSPRTREESLLVLLANRLARATKAPLMAFTISIPTFVRESRGCARVNYVSIGSHLGEESRPPNMGLRATTTVAERRGTWRFESEEEGGKKVERETASTVNYYCR